jgi:circadian clock protein KaiC
MPSAADSREDKDLVRTGTTGLDEVLSGGLPARRIYLLQGDPGTGKTTLALRFLIEGAVRGEKVLYLALSESHEELDQVARSHGWSLDGVTIVDQSTAVEERETTLFQPSEVELGARMRALLEQLDRLRPSRIVVDSCSELRLLSQGPLRYRRQILALKARASTPGSTILLIDTLVAGAPEMLLQSVVHGVLILEQLSPLYGAERRRMRVAKLRGRKYRGGYHDFTIRTGGLEIFPRLVASEHHLPYQRAPVSSGIDTLDALLGGGPDRGSSLLLMGPAGCGKSAIASRYSLAAAERGERTAAFAFDEGVGMYLARAASLGMPLEKHLASGVLTLQQVDPAELSPGEFAQAVRWAVERDGARLVVIDSLNGYLNAMAEEQLLALQIHELLAYLAQRGVLTLLTVAQHGLVGPETTAPVDLSYIADAVLLFRYFEFEGRVRKAISVVKKRSGAHEQTIRELMLGAGGVTVGPPLAQFQGVLTGAPLFGPGAPDPADGRREPG